MEESCHVINKFENGEVKYDGPLIHKIDKEESEYGGPLIGNREDYKNFKKDQNDE